MAVIQVDGAYSSWEWNCPPCQRQTMHFYTTAHKARESFKRHELTKRHQKALASSSEPSPQTEPRSQA